jgi:RNA polymerase sigma-70 factor (ECF subfamily)
MKLRSNAEWLTDLQNDIAKSEALEDLREYLLRAVYLYLDRYHEELAELDQRELEHMAEDFTQEALLQIQAHLGTFRGESKFTTWAYRFVINVAAAELRQSRGRTLSLDALINENGEPLFTFLSDREAPNPETMAARNQIVELILKIMNEELTERQRFALLSVHFYGTPMDTVARQLDTTPNNVYKLIHDARKKLRDGLRRRFYSESDILTIFGGA